MKFELSAIGFVEAARQQAEDDYWGGQTSCIVLNQDFEESALQGLEDFSHVEVIFIFDRVTADKIVSTARHPRNNQAWPAVGIFAQRGKNRPNRLGSTICKIVRREGCRLYVSELDAIDGTPVLDLKPVMREFLPRTTVSQPDWASELMRHYWAGS